MFIGHFLLGDINYRMERSFTVAPYTHDVTLMEFLALPKSCPVLDDVKVFLNCTIPVKDSQRQNLRFTPSFAGFSFLHDFAYSATIQVFLNIHDILASNRTNTDPNVIMMKIYKSKLATVSDTNYTISNLFARPFTIENQATQHRNWLFSSALESFINPEVGRTLVQRPTSSKI